MSIAAGESPARISAAWKRIDKLLRGRDPRLLAPLRPPLAPAGPCPHLNQPRRPCQHSRIRALLVLLTTMISSCLRLPAARDNSKATLVVATGESDGPHGECFGGVPSIVAAGQYEPHNPVVVGGQLYWSGSGLWRMAPGALQAVRVDGSLGSLWLLVPERGSEAFSLDAQETLIAFDLRTKRSHLVLAGRLPDAVHVDTLIAADDRHVYFTQSGPLFQEEDTGLFRILRDGSGKPESLGREPGPGATIVVADGFLYYRGRRPDGQLALLRRALVAHASVGVLTSLESLPQKNAMRVFGGRIYYVDDDTLWSIAVRGGEQPKRHVPVGRDGARDMLVDRGCLYWSNGRTIKRVSMGVGAPAPEVIADERSYQVAESLDATSELATDGDFLYWADAGGERIMRVGRASKVQPAGPALVAQPIPPQPRYPVQVEAIAVGDGWGCERFHDSGELYWQCWNAPGAYSASKIAARDIPWLSGEGLRARAKQICAPIGDEGKCWSWPDFMEGRPSDVPTASDWRDTDKQLLDHGFGATFTCSMSILFWTCFGDDSFGQLGARGRDFFPSGGNLVTGYWHACVSHPSDGTLCWGRGDGGQLGFRASEACTRRSIPCSYSPRPTAFALPNDIGELVAGDMFTCARSAKQGLLCWGASREGLFGTADACPASLRRQWPTLSGSVAAPSATCSRTPAAVPGVASGVHGISAGPRGICGMGPGGDGRADRPQCVGAIPTPEIEVRDVIVSPGEQASACGIAGGEAVCWGEGYSPTASPKVAVYVVPDRPPVTGALGLDATAPGVPWAPSCRIHYACDHPTPSLPKCSGEVSAQTWAATLPKAETLVGKPITVRGPLLLGPRKRGRGYRRSARADISEQCAHGECCNHSPQPIVIGGADHELGLIGLECTGDDSRVCCNAAAVGQAVIAKGTLKHVHGSSMSDPWTWELASPELCALDGRP